MTHDRAVLVDSLSSLDMDQSQQAVYDRPIGLRLLSQDSESGAEHYLVRYPAGLRARWHRHTAAQTLVVLEGRLEANGQELGPMAYCHFPAGQAMRHAPAAGESCLFVTMFDGPFDIEPLGEEASFRRELWDLRPERR